MINDRLTKTRPAVVTRQTDAYHAGYYAFDPDEPRTETPDASIPEHLEKHWHKGFDDAAREHWDMEARRRAEERREAPWKAATAALKSAGFTTRQEAALHKVLHVLRQQIED